MRYDKIVIGGGLYGLYSALICGRNGQKVLVLEYESESFKRATYINQARVHMGYHYPRSLSTAVKSARYFEKFSRDYADCILTTFDQVYATSRDFSWTNAEQFRKFCRETNIRCDEISPSKYFQEGKCDGAFLTQEYTYDAMLLKARFLSELAEYSGVSLVYHARIVRIEQDSGEYAVTMADGTVYRSPFVLNASYASVNQICALAGYEPFRIKYELCEIILCRVDDALKNLGLTVMDGPFFSIMPFGKTGYHSLTAVTFTPHITSYEEAPTFPCQERCEPGYCCPGQLGNCNECSARPSTAWAYMSSLAKKYMKEELGFTYEKSLFSMKPILKSSEIDDSRPTVIKEFSKSPVFISVLSGKINTVYDLDEVLLHGQ